jgi:ATP-binding cassette subfamily B protein
MDEVDYRQKARWPTWKALLAFAKPFKGSFAAVAGLMVVTAAFDAMVPFVTGWAIDEMIAPGRLEALPWFVVGFVVFMTAHAASIFGFFVKCGRIEAGVNRGIRKALFAKLQALSFAYYDRTNTGWITSRVTSDTSKLAEVMAWSIVDLAWGGAMMAFSAALMFARNWVLALVALSVVVPIALAAVVMERTLTEKSREVRKTNSKITAALSEGIAGARTVKTLVAEDRRKRAFMALSARMRSTSTRRAALSAAYLPIVLTLGYVGTSMALWTGSGFVVGGIVTFGSLAAFVFSALQFFDPITDVAYVFTEFQYAQASAERVVSMLQEPVGVADGEEALRLLAAGEAPFRLKGAISFEGVSFEYLPGKPVLHDFSLEVRPGQTIALVGETGSGKSTIVNLACRFYEPSSGRITIDGRDYRDLPLTTIYSNLGYVLQQPYLFSGTVAENIRYGKLDASDAEVESAARTACAHGFIAGLEKGYDTQVGEGGAVLSTGQKQLISFARAVLADPAFLVLDEATSSVDTETEREVQGALSSVMRGRTSFVVAHRLSTITAADLIVVMRDGRSVERGTHAELLAAKGYYWRLFTAQFLDERETSALAASSAESADAVSA